MTVERSVWARCGVRAGRLLCWSIAVALAATALPAVGGHAADAGCARTAMPYRGIAGAALTPTDYVSRDVPPVLYTRWRGMVPGFDGMPFSVDVTVPCDSTG